jgi:CBS domain-containing protein
MLRAYDVMTRAVATATPQTPVSQVAAMMRDLNIGDVLVCQDGKLQGIVTDRDLTINVLTNGANSSAPVERYMSTDVVTGSPDWSLEQVANVMGEHQIRRLPILQDDNLVGIVSLGDVAVHTSKPTNVADSLKNISEVTRTRFNQASPLTRVAWIAIPVGVAAAVLLYANSNSGKRVRKQLSESDLAEQARTVVNDAVHALQDPRTRQAAFDALEATGLPEKTRTVLQEGVRTLQNTQARANQVTHDVSQDGTRASEYAMHLAEQARQRAQQLPHEVTRRLQKSKPKRFIFA